MAKGRFSYDRVCIPSPLKNRPVKSLHLTPLTGLDMEPFVGHQPVSSKLFFTAFEPEVARDVRFSEFVTPTP